MNQGVLGKGRSWTMLIAAGALGLAGLGCQPGTDRTGSPGVEEHQNQDRQHHPPPPQDKGRNAGGMGHGPSGADFVKRLDKDGDGQVSKSEFDGPADHFSQFDKNGDGYLNEDEAPAGPPAGSGSPSGSGPPAGSGAPAGSGPPQGQRPPRH